MKLFTTLLDETIHKTLKELSATSGKTISKLIEEAIIDLIKKYGNN